MEGTFTEGMMMAFECTEGLLTYNAQLLGWFVGSCMIVLLLMIIMAIIFNIVEKYLI